MVGKGGKLLIERISPQVDDIVISANRNMDEYKKYTSHVIHDKTDDYQGPLSGITACIPDCKHEWILVIPCDIPLLPDDLASRLNHTNNSKLVVAKAHKRRQLVFLMHSSLKGSLDKYLSDGHHKAMSWIELQNPSVVKFEDEAGAFLNINSQYELKSLDKK